MYQSDRLEESGVRDSELCGYCHRPPDAQPEIENFSLSPHRPSQKTRRVPKRKP